VSVILAKYALPKVHNIGLPQYFPKNYVIPFSNYLENNRISFSIVAEKSNEITVEHEFVMLATVQS